MYVVSGENRLHAEDAVVDVGEAPRLLPGPPDLDLAGSREHGLSNLSAYRRRSLLAPAVVCPERSEHVVKTGHSCSQAEVLAEMPAHSLAEELLPPIAVLRHGRIRVVFPEAGHARVSLLVVRVDAGRGREEEALDARLPRGDEQMGVDEHAQHAEGPVVLDEAHSPHVGGEVVNDRSVAHRAPAIGELLQVEAAVIDIREALIPTVDRLEVDRSQPRVALAPQVGDQVASDEASGATHDDALRVIDRHRSSVTSRCLLDPLLQQQRAQFAVVRGAENAGYEVLRREHLDATRAPALGREIR